MATTAAIETEKVKSNSKLGHVPVFGIDSSANELDEERCCRVAEAAYYKAMARGFAPGYEMEDWLAAEAEQS